MLTKIVSFFTSIIIAICSALGISIAKEGKELNADILAKNVQVSQEKFMKNGELFGSHVVITQNSKTVLDKTYGTSSVNGEALKDDALYRIASMTKPITAVALLIAQEQGLLNIQDDVSKYIPEFAHMKVAVEFSEDGSMVKMTKDATNPVKLYMLVSHTSGVASGKMERFMNAYVTKDATCESIAKAAANQPLSYDPGTAQEYSTLAFDVAAYIIEMQSGMEYYEFIKTNIFDKLGMVDTTFEPTPEQFARMITVHQKLDGKNADYPMSTDTVFGGWPVTFHAAGAALASTTYDYVKFAEMLLNNGVGSNGVRILSEESVKLMKTPVVSDDVMSGSQKWGLGVRVITDDKYTLPEGAFGWSGAYGTHFWIDPANKLTVVYMRNSVSNGGAGCETANKMEKDVMKSMTLKDLQ